MTTLNFHEVRRTVERSLPCASCGKMLRRTFTGTATYNPFNQGDPPVQAGEEARRLADKAEADGVTCQWCAETPVREALLAFADGVPLPERKWNNATDILLDRENIKELFDHELCPCCQEWRWKSRGYEITPKGRRVIEKARAAIVRATGAA